MTTAATCLILFFSNFADLSVDHAEYSLVQPDHFQPLLSLTVQCQFDVINKICKKILKEIFGWGL
jgi:hypothetical protein